MRKLSCRGIVGWFLSASGVLLLPWWGSELDLAIENGGWSVAGLCIALICISGGFVMLGTERVRKEVNQRIDAEVAVLSKALQSIATPGGGEKSPVSAEPRQNDSVAPGSPAQ